MPESTATATAAPVAAPKPEKAGNNRRALIFLAVGVGLLLAVFATRTFMGGGGSSSSSTSSSGGSAAKFPAASAKPGAAPVTPAPKPAPPAPPATTAPTVPAGPAPNTTRDPFHALR